MRGRLLFGLGLLLAVVAVAGLASLRAQEAPKPPKPHEAPEAPPAVAIGSGGFLGVYLEEVDQEAVDRLGLRAERGAMIVEVSEEGPAAQAGLRKDDVVIGFNGESVQSVAQLSRMVRETPPGRTVSLEVIREGQTRKFSVKLGDRPGMVWVGPDIDRHGVFIAPGGGEPHVLAFGGRGRLGVQLESLGDQLAEYFGVDGGALITSVREDTPAAAAGLKAGDVITKVGERKIDDASDVVEAVHEADEGPLSITVVRDGQARTLTADLPERHSRWDWQDDGSYDYSFVLPDIQIPEFFVPEIRTPSVTVPEIKIPAIEIGADGESWFTIPEIRIPEFGIPEVQVPEVRVPEVDIPGQEVTIRLPAHIV